jgi:hypothetical protein
MRDDGSVSEIGLGGVAGARTGRLYYGWYIVAVCNVVAMMTWGIGVFNQGVFLGYFVDTYGWQRAALSLGPMLFYVWAGLVGVVIGRLIDRRGAWRCGSLGAGGRLDHPRPDDGDHRLDPAGGRRGLLRTTRVRAGLRPDLPGDSTWDRLRVAGVRADRDGVW